MDWKGFLKPNRSIIALFVIFILLLLPVSIVCPSSSTGPVMAGGNCAFKNVVGTEYYEFSEVSYYQDGFILTLWDNSAIFISGVIIILYLLSCLISFSYNEFKSKNKLQRA